MREPKDIKIGNYTLEEILERHLHWLNRDCENWESMQADLHNADLRGADMSNADLRSADMSGADLSYASLYDANLRNANMSDTDLSYTNLYGTNMRDANMSNANMRNANLRSANMSNADLSYTNLCGTNMRDANMRNANMRNADMIYADLSYTNLHDANLCDADRLRKGIKLSEPIIGWKKCKNNVLVKLEIPRGAIVFSINNGKCRTDKAKVLEIIGGNRAYSKYKFFSYYVGDIIEVFDFNCEYNVECAKGIHFFKTREEAENY